MKYFTRVEDKEYTVIVEEINDKSIGKEEIDKEERLLNNRIDNFGIDICWDAAKSEYEHEIARALKLDNKVYILLSVCALIFSILISYISKIPKVKKVNNNWDPEHPFWQVHYSFFVIIVALLFLIVFVCLIVLLSNIKMTRFDCMVELEKNLMAYPKKTVTKFIVSKYVQAIAENRKRLWKRYKIFNFSVLMMLVTTIGVLALAYISNCVVFNK